MSARKIGRWSGCMSRWEERSPIQTPIRRSHTIPEPVARLIYEQYAYENGTSQSFERLHQRGGFGMIEAIGLLADLIERERTASAQ